jgi:hypothetical protein
MSKDEYNCCPICTEELDPTDKSFIPCPCGYQVRQPFVSCLFVFNNLARLFFSHPSNIVCVYLQIQSLIQQRTFDRLLVCVISHFSQTLFLFLFEK